MMKSSHYFLALAGALLLAASCQTGREEDYRQRESRPQTSQASREAGLTVITASLEQTPDSKTSMAAGRKVVWEAGDRIKVFNASLRSGTVYTLDESTAGSAKGRFTGYSLPGSGPYYAIYPADAAGRLDGTSVSVTLPQSQSWASESFGDGASLALACAPSLDALDFKNVLGAVSISLTATENIKSIVVQSKADEVLAGSGSVSVTTEDPVLTLDAEGSRTLTLDCTGHKAGKFLLMLPPGVFSQGFTVFIQDKDGNVMFREAKASKANTIVRSQVLAMPAFAYEAQFRSAFLDQAGFGYYKGVNSSSSGIDASLSFDRNRGQYATRTEAGTSRYSRVEDWDAAFSIAATTPYDLTAGGVYPVTLDLMQEDGITQTSGQFLVLKVSDSAAWLVATDNSGIGFIQPLED